MRSGCPDYIDLTGLQIHFLLRFPQEQPHVSFQDVKSVGYMGVAMPRYLLHRRKLQLQNAKARARGMLNATLRVIKMTGVPDRLPLFHVGLPLAAYRRRSKHPGNLSRCPDLVGPLPRNSGPLSSRQFQRPSTFRVLEVDQKW